MVDEKETVPETEPETPETEAVDAESAPDVDIPQAPEEPAPADAGGDAAALAAQVADLNDKLLRALADTENTRRRAERQVEDASKYAIANFARDMLTVSDNLRRALDSVDAEARKADEALETLCAGIEMTESEMLNTFSRMGIAPIETEGKRLDPNLHEAMFELENPDVPAGTIVQVIRTGYTLGDRLLRSAQVGVAKGGPKGVPDGPAEADAYDDKGGAVGEDKGVNLDENL